MKKGSDTMKLISCLLVTFLYCFSATAVAGEPDDSKIKCSKFGRKFTDEFKSEYYHSDISMWGNPEFHYNKALKSCLVYTEIIDGELNKEVDYIWYYRRITDVYTNRVVAYSRYFVVKNESNKKETMVNLGNVGDAVNLPSSKFIAEKVNLFSQ